MVISFVVIAHVGIACTRIDCVQFFLGCFLEIACVAAWTVCVMIAFVVFARMENACMMIACVVIACMVIAFMVIACTEISIFEIACMCFFRLLIGRLLMCMN